MAQDVVFLRLAIRVPLRKGLPRVSVVRAQRAMILEAAVHKQMGSEFFEGLQNFQALFLETTRSHHRMPEAHNERWQGDSFPPCHE